MIGSGDLDWFKIHTYLISMLQSKFVYYFLELVLITKYWTGQENQVKRIAAVLHSAMQIKQLEEYSR